MKLYDKLRRSKWSKEKKAYNLARVKRWEIANKEQRNKKRLINSRKHDYGVTEEQYNEMLASQDNKCAICKNEETAMKNGRVLPLAVDHDHKTGLIRGLVCLRCNHGLGAFKDDIVRLESAINYLRKTQQKIR